MTERPLHDAILDAYCQCDPYPAQLQLSPELEARLLKDDFDGKIYIKSMTERSFAGVRYVVFPGMVGWRVISVDANDPDFMDPEGTSEVYIEKPRLVIASEDFDDSQTIGTCERCGTTAYKKAVLANMQGRCYRCHDQTTYWYCR